MIIGAYCVGKVHNMLPQYYNDNWSILCMLGTKYLSSFILLEADCVGTVQYNGT